MAGDIDELLELQRKMICEDKKRLGMIKDVEIQYEHCDKEHQANNNCQQSGEDKENRLSSVNVVESTVENKKLPLNERLDLNSNDGTLEESKRDFVDKLVNSENPLTFRSNEDKETSSNNNKMLRYGEFSPNNPELRVNAAPAPYLGLGEYELRRNLFLQRQRDDYLAHLAQRTETFLKTSTTPIVNVKSPAVTKAVQTRLKGIQCPLVQYDLSQLSSEEDLTYGSSSTLRQTTNPGLPSPSSYLVDQRLTSAQNALSLKLDMDKPKSILSKRRTGSPRERFVSEFSHSYTPTSTFMDGFSFQNHDEEMERERLKRENYQRELRMQIDEKRRMQAMREEQDRIEQELENKRLEQQLLRMQEEQAIEDQIRNRRDEQMRRHSEELLRRKHELQSRNPYRKHGESDSIALPLPSASSPFGSYVHHQQPQQQHLHYSPPVSRRAYGSNATAQGAYSDPSPTSTAASARYALANRYDTNAVSASSLYHRNRDGYDGGAAARRFNTFGRYESLSRIDSLRRQEEPPLHQRFESLSVHGDDDDYAGIGCSAGTRRRLCERQRRHSATQQDLRRSCSSASGSMGSPKTLQQQQQRRRYEEALQSMQSAVPVLKARSPVARELRHAVPFNSTRHGGSGGTSEALRKLEDKWQIPAVQKNIVNHHVDGSSMRDGPNRSILTQLGAIRMQLQQEQLRMDETLRRGNYSQNKAVDFH